MAKFKDIFYIKQPTKEGGKPFWNKVGTAWVNKDGSLSLMADVPFVVTPGDRTYVIRDHVEKDKDGESFED
jgi:hypothetical protein